MRLVRKLGGVVVLLALVGLLAARPLLSNPAVATAVEDGFADRRSLLVLPLVVVTLLLAGLRINALRDDDDGSTTGYQPAEKNSWTVDEPGDDADGGPGNSDFLSGQGGARDRDFEIEEEPPDAHLAGHLEHLEEELGDDEELRRDLETLGEVVEETEDEQTLPARCPYEYCGAAWRERGIVGLKSGTYELLDDGTTVRCLECERTVSLE